MTLVDRSSDIRRTSSNVVEPAAATEAGQPNVLDGVAVVADDGVDVRLSSVGIRVVNARSHNDPNRSVRTFSIMTTT